MNTGSTVRAVIAGVGLVVGSLAVAPVEAGAAESSKRPIGGADITTTGDISIVASHEDSRGGWIAYTGDGRVTVRSKPAPAPKGQAPVTTRVVAGGVWTYGSYTSWSWNGPRKVCYSKYYHRSYYHSSSVKIGGRSDADGARAGRTANSRRSGSVGSTCYAYWRR